MDVVIVITEFKRLLKSRGYADKTIEQYSWGLNEFREWLISQDIMDLRKVNHSLIQDYQSGIANQNIAQETCAAKIRPVKRLFEYLIDTHKLLINPTDKIIETCRVNRKVGIVLTIDEIRRLMEQPNLSLRTGIRNRAIMEVLYCTAIRSNELLSLTVYDPDLKDQILYIRKGKGKKQRVVPLNKTAHFYLTEYLTQIRPRYAKKNPRERALFLTISAQPMTRGAMTQLLRVSRMCAGIIKNVTAHTMRRTCATHMLRNGADIRYIQKLLGHVYLKTTQRYIQVSSKEVKATHEAAHPGKQILADLSAEALTKEVEE